MDHGSFDKLVRLFGAAGSRRAALGALLGTGLAGTLGAADAARKGRKHRRGGKKGKAQVSAQAADCLSPGPSSNMNGCNFNNDDFSGQDLSSSSMRGTTFRGADLTCADLSSSQLKNADFRGPNAGNPTLLFGADLSSSGCAGVLFNQHTKFCGTIMCNGTVRNDDCPPGVDSFGCDLQPRQPCTENIQCSQADGTAVCEVIPFDVCGPLVPVCCLQTGGTCDNGCDCCGSNECFGGVCGGT